MLRSHRSTIESAIHESIAAVTSSLNVVQLSPTTGYIEGEVGFVGGVRLSFFEFWRRASEGIKREKYRYHLMDTQNQLIFRYDNAPHHPAIATFPHHKHLPDKTVASRPPDFVDVLAEVEVYVLGIP